MNGKEYQCGEYRKKQRQQQQQHRESVARFQCYLATNNYDVVCLTYSRDDQITPNFRMQLQKEGKKPGPSSCLRIQIWCCLVCLMPWNRAQFSRPFLKILFTLFLGARAHVCIISFIASCSNERGCALANCVLSSNNNFSSCSPSLLLLLCHPNHNNLFKLSPVWTLHVLFCRATAAAAWFSRLHAQIYPSFS